MSRLDVRDISRSFTADGRPRPVLSHVSLSVATGELVCLLGPSGCGKTTLLRIVASLDTDCTGTVTVDGRATVQPGPDRIMLFQDQQQVFPWRRVEENIGLPLQLKKAPNWREETRRVAAQVGLSDALRLYPHQLSGGMRQRVALARALAAQPAVLLMDEPFASLDSVTRESLQELLLGIHKDRKATILFVTHQIEEAIVLADRILVMSRDGRIVHQTRVTGKRPRRPASDTDRALAEQLHSIMADC